MHATIALVHQSIDTRRQKGQDLDPQQHGAADHNGEGTGNSFQPELSPTGKLTEQTLVPEEVASELITMRG